MIETKNNNPTIGRTLYFHWLNLGLKDDKRVAKYNIKASLRNSAGWKETPTIDNQP